MVTPGLNADSISPSASEAISYVLGDVFARNSNRLREMRQLNYHPRASRFQSALETWNLNPP